MTWFVRDRLPMARVIMIGPRWRGFLVMFVYIASGRLYRRRVYDQEDDVRELVCRGELRPGVTAMWSDPREVAAQWRHRCT